MPCDAFPTALWVTYLIGGLTAILAAAATHVFAIFRERSFRKHAARIAKENRKQDFLGLLSGIRLRAERMAGTSHYMSVFNENIFQIRRECPKVRRDLNTNRREEFDKAIEALCGLGDSEVGIQHQGGGHEKARTLVTEKIDAIEKSLR